MKCCERAAFTIYSTSNFRGYLDCFRFCSRFPQRYHSVWIRKITDLNLKLLTKWESWLFSWKAEICRREMDLSLLRARDHSDCACAHAFPGWTSPLFSECVHRSACWVLLWHPDVQLLQTQTHFSWCLPVTHAHTHTLFEVTLQWECLQLQSDGTGCANVH